MTAIYMREMRSYFTSPIGYIFTAIYFAVSGFCFYYMVLSDGVLIFRILPPPPILPICSAVMLFPS